MALHRLAYARLSRVEQAKGYTLQDQIQTLEDWGFDELFQDLESGRKTDRAGFTAMITRARDLASQPRTEVVIRVARHDRWARNVVFSLGLIQELEALGVTVESLDRGKISLSTAMDFLQTANEAVQAELESRRIGERIKTNYENRRRHARPSGNRAPFGYAYTRDRWVPGENWALARGAIEHFLQHGNIRRLVIWLKNQGVEKSRFGVRHWLQSPAIRGHQEYKGEIIYNTHEPLITPTEAKAIEQRFQQNRELRGANVTATRYAVPTSLCVCEACGRKMTSKTRTGARYLLCRYRKEGNCPSPPKFCRDTWIEAAIQEAIQERAEWVVSRLGAETGTDPRLPEKERELQQLQKLAHVPGVADAIALLESEIDQIKTATQVRATDSEERDRRIVELAGLLPGDWAAISDEDRRGLYAYLVREVRVLGGEVCEVVLW